MDNEPNVNNTIEFFRACKRRNYSLTEIKRAYSQVLTHHHLSKEDLDEVRRAHIEIFGPEISYLVGETRVGDSDWSMDHLDGGLVKMAKEKLHNLNPSFLEERERNRGEYEDLLSKKVDVHNSGDNPFNPNASGLVLSSGRRMYPDGTHS